MLPGGIPFWYLHGGDVIEEMEGEEGYIIHDVDLKEADSIRRQLPLFQARRTDIYQSENGAEF